MRFRKDKNVGVLDYRKQRFFSVAAAAEQCFQAFYRAMSKTGMGVGAIRWDLGRASARITPDLDEQEWPAYVATFAGRAGLGGLLGALTEQGQRAEQSMKGTQITFAVNPQTSGGRTECAMWLSNSLSGLWMPFGDMMFLRNYMNDVEQQLRALDPALTMNKV